jgi:hypothetical protein
MGEGRVARQPLAAVIVGEHHQCVLPHSVSIESRQSRPNALIIRTAALTTRISWIVSNKRLIWFATWDTGVLIRYGFLDISILEDVFLHLRGPWCGALW